MLDNSDMPHSHGLDVSGGAEATRQTPACISHLPTDDPLRTESALPEGSVKQGITPDSLGKDTMSALDKGYQPFTPSSDYPDGSPIATDTVVKGGADPATLDGGDALSGFLGRTWPLNR